MAQSLKGADTKEAKLQSTKNLCVACFDYEKTLICPKAKASVFYYKRKFGVSNFTIVDVGTNDSFCYVYDETTANKGSNEVASFLFHFIKNKVEAGVNDFRFYSDNCPGQNKNRIIAALFLHAANKFNIRIVHRFLEKGHTYNAADTVHSLIERKTKLYDIYTPQQWYDRINTAKRSEAHPITVIKVEQSMIFAWKDLLEKLNLDKDVFGRVVSWTKIREISIICSSSSEIKFKINFDDTPSVISTRKIGRPVNFQTYEPELAFRGLLPIAKAKFQDLKHYCDNNFIPEEFHEFYRGLAHGEEEKTISEDEELDEP